MSARDRLAALRRTLRRTLLARRRLLAALLTAVAVAAGLRATTTDPPARVVVTVAAHDLPAGTMLDAGDVRHAEFAPGSVPEGLARDPAGRTLAAPLRAGEPVTDVRLVGPALTDGYPGLVAVPVRLPDAGMAGLLRVGDRVDLVSADPQGGSAGVVADAVPVLALPDAPAEVSATGLTGRLVVVGAEPGDVERIADASVRTFLTIAFSD
ncbi:SAF domain-containing protein [Nocardioides sp. YIM 152315]|uniref:SAF domain-containing protein n=1 Tax=Nocardioides sp. YIM 152315 TaxID=3031760 RepID=UPI0023D98D68|nr:SAF domain-containing protein [Nocardioides sp. YIM 152315]MDF1605925.1 SAF domain-containing protein [Nocardioides sp. YIM 152315]